ncbi:MAG: rhodanese-like domain-containing protein [Cellulophaga sp.]
MKVKIYCLVCFLLILSQIVSGQQTIDAILQLQNDSIVAYISTEELQEKPPVFLLDSRKKKEYKVSHIANAVWVGYNKFKPKTITRLIPDKSTSIVVYCSIGVRSNQIGEKLVKMGYTNVHNLYGGIFKWANEKKPVVDSKNTFTKKVHAYDKTWGKLLHIKEKVY